MMGGQKNKKRKSGLTLTRTIEKKRVKKRESRWKSTRKKRAKKHEKTEEKIKKNGGKCTFSEVVV